MDSMDLKAGQVVRSKAGRDKGRLFVVIKVEGLYAFVADGSLRKIEKPKKKKMKHLVRYNIINWSIRKEV